MPTTEWLAPQTVASTGDGEPWTWLTFCKTADGRGAVVTLDAAHRYSQRLTATGWGLAALLPADARNFGIEARAVRERVNVCRAFDHAWYLTLDGVTPVGDNQSDEAEWPYPYAAYTRGAADSDWGASLTRAALAAETFGVMLACATDTAFAPQYQVDADVDTLELRVSYETISGAWSARQHNLVLTADAAGLIPPTGYTIAQYTWAWGDGSTSTVTPDAVAAHRYAAGGAYTVTVTACLNDGGTATFSREVLMASITHLAPLMAVSGDETTGTEIRISGAGFAAEQGDGTVEIGGVTAVVTDWSDTLIVCRSPLSTPLLLGTQDVTVSNADGDRATACDGIYLYDATDRKDSGALALGIVDEVFLNGVQVGFTRDALDMTFRTREVAFEPADRFDTVQVWTYTGPTEVRVTFAQLNGERLAQLLGGSYSAVTRTLSLAGNDMLPELSLAVKEAGGVTHVFRRVKVTGDLTLALNKEAKSLPVTFRVLALNDATAKKYECSFPG